MRDRQLRKLLGVTEANADRSYLFIAAHGYGKLTEMGDVLREHSQKIELLLNHLNL